MKQHIVSAGGDKRLILFFAGWGMDADMFAGISRPGYDIMVVYDYTNPDFNLAAIENYEEIVVAAWSMGVYYADRFIRDYNLGKPVLTKCIAVNGTLSPIDDNLGIPRRIYELTSALPDRNAVDKFCRRICGGASAMQTLMPKAPSRSVDELRDELLSIRRMVESNPLPSADTSLWDEILISERDLIFPPANMLRAWENASERITVLPEAAHIIDFGNAFERLFVDKPLVGKRFGAALPTYDSDAEVQRKVAERLGAIIADRQARKTDIDILEVGSGSGMLTRIYEPMFEHCRISFVDLSPTEYPCSNGNIHRSFASDAETMLANTESDSYDLIISSSSIQWFNSPRRFIANAIRTLRSGGNLFFAFFAKGTLDSIADIATLRYPSVDREFLEASGCSFEIDEESISISFDSPNDALRHLKRTGVNSIRRTPTPIGRTREILSRITDSKGKATLSFKTIYLTISKP